MTRLINFTAGEARAILHRLEVPDAIADALTDDGDTWGRDEVYERAEYMENELRRTGGIHYAEHACDLTLAVLTDCVESSTWPAAHDPAYNTDNTPQGHAAAVRCLHRAMLKIADAFGKSPDYFDFPQA